MEVKNKKTGTPAFSGLAIALIAILAILLAIVSVKFFKTDKQKTEIQQEYDELISEHYQQDSVMNTMEDIFDEIQYNLTYIQEKRGQLVINSQEGGKDPRQQIVEDVKQMDRILHESEAKIAELQKELKKAGKAIPAYEKRIAALQETIRQQNQDMLDLQQVISVQNFKLTDFQQKVELMDQRLNNQSDSIATQSEILKETDRKLHLGYVAYGTAKELKEKNLVSSQGGILGLGASKELPSDFDSSYFMEVDMRDATQVSLHTKKAELITQHPENSYHFEEKNGEVLFLSIDNPKDFWKVSRFVVIQVK
ncbi:MAG: hypothetical protein ACK5IJ_00325 [Mangrovibacterium sp.]